MTVFMFGFGSGPITDLSSCSQRATQFRCATSPLRRSPDTTTACFMSTLHDLFLRRVCFRRRQCLVVVCPLAQLAGSRLVPSDTATRSIPQFSWRIMRRRSPTSNCVPASSIVVDGQVVRLTEEALCWSGPVNQKGVSLGCWLPRSKWRMRDSPISWTWEVPSFFGTTCAQDGPVGSWVHSYVGLHLSQRRSRRALRPTSCSPARFCVCHLAIHWSVRCRGTTEVFQVLREGGSSASTIQGQHSRY